MFKYTANKEVADQYTKLSQKWCPEANDTLWNLSIRIAGTADAVFACGDFWREYTGTEFYSKTRLDRIPVNGVLLEAEWFEETVV